MTYPQYQWRPNVNSARSRHIWLLTFNVNYYGLPVIPMEAKCKQCQKQTYLVTYIQCFHGLPAISMEAKSKQCQK